MQGDPSTVTSVRTAWLRITDSAIALTRSRPQLSLRTNACRDGRQHMQTPPLLALGNDISYRNLNTYPMIRGRVPKCDYRDLRPTARNCNSGQARTYWSRHESYRTLLPNFSPVTLGNPFSRFPDVSPQIFVLAVYNNLYVYKRNAHALWECNCSSTVSGCSTALLYDSVHNRTLTFVNCPQVHHKEWRQLAFRKHAQPHREQELFKCF